MSDAPKAVFLSYASQDGAAALRICTTLRAAGIEVWFDKNELVGGDAWDQKIRRQIKDCALLIPIISANTQSRTEGYFRLEWRLADQRTHLMAKGRPFLLPVVIDDTRDADAHVPDSFTEVQWTRLPAGVPTPAFVERLQRLLAAKPVEPGAPASPAPRSLETAAPARRKSFPPALGLALGVVAISVTVVLFVTRRREPAPLAPSVDVVKPASSAASAPAPVANAKSIAVLPFANRSPDKENEFFTDGVHEDILTNLFNIRALRVVSRTSVEQYRGTKKGVKEIGAELSVAYLLEGSVQRVGNKVRVAAKLIDARTDAPVWAQSFDKDLSDVFAIQAEIAKAIASELQTVLSPQEQKQIERRPTENVAAYDVYLKARSIDRGTIVGQNAREPLLRAAVELDPRFAVAWANLAVNHGYVYRDQERTPSRLALAEAALARAAELAPDDPAIITARGYLAYLGRRDWPRATLEFEKIIQLQPSNADALYGLATIQKRQGRWLESVANHRQALQLDPGNGAILGDLARLLAAGRRWDDALRVERQRAANQPKGTNHLRWAFSASGSTQAADDWLAGLIPAQREAPAAVELRMWRAIIRGDHQEWKRLDGLPSLFTLRGGFFVTPEGQTIFAAMVIAASGDTEGARLRLGKLPAEGRAKLELDSTNDNLWSELALMEALLGRKAEALRAAGKAVELMPESLDASSGPRRSGALAAVYAWTGDKDRALAELARLLRIPNGYHGSVHDLRVDPAFAPLRGDPRFEALLKDPKNSAPLF